MRLSIRKKICVMLAVCLLLPFLPAQAEGTDIKALQTRLLDLGYEIGKADGIFGKKTSAAIALAQTLLAEQGFEVQSTGTPDVKTVELIMKEENSGLLQMLVKGSWGSRVKGVQQKLIGLNLLRSSADGQATGGTTSGPGQTKWKADHRRI